MAGFGSTVGDACLRLEALVEAHRACLVSPSSYVRVGSAIARVTVTATDALIAFSLVEEHTVVGSYSTAADTLQVVTANCLADK